MNRRREFPTSVQRAALERSGRRCESTRVPSIANIGCNRKLRTGDFNYDHIQADGIGGEPTLDNCAVLCKVCHGIKTRTHDVPAIAGMKRARDRDTGIRDPWKKRLPGSRTGPFKLKIGGGVVDRRTNDPWRAR